MTGKIENEENLEAMVLLTTLKRAINEFKEATSQDKDLQILIHFIQREFQIQIKIYHQRQDNISVLQKN